MKVVLINPPPGIAQGINSAMVMPPLGLLYLGAVLERGGHDVQILDAHLMGLDCVQIAERFDFKPDLIGLSTNITNSKESFECANRLKRAYPDALVILGGPYVSALAAFDFNKYQGVDGVVVGEGELTLLEVVDSLGHRDKLANIKGFRYKGPLVNIHSNLRPLISDLDSLPLPAYHLLTGLRKYKTRSRGSPAGFIFTSRGCPYGCTFCNRSIFGSTWRAHSPERVIREIDCLVKNFGIRQLDVLDDNFCLDKERATKIFDGIIKSGYKLWINLQHGVRIDSLDRELLLQMKKAGVFKIGFAIETADQDIQNSIKKKIDLSRALEIVETARSLGFITHAFFILGFPGDSPVTMKKTIDFSIRMNPHFANFALCCPMPGTELFEEIRSRPRFLQNMEDGADSGFFGGKAFFATDFMTKEDVTLYFRMAYKNFYLRARKVIDILKTIRSLTELMWFMRALFDSLKIAIKNVYL